MKQSNIQKKSPIKFEGKARLYNFSEITSYSKINRPFMNESKKNSIRAKLDLEK